EWDSETDVAGALNVRHYSFLAKQDATIVGPSAPYRGAYCLEINMLGDTADHVLIEGDIDIADTVTRYTRFALFIGKDVTGVTDIFNIFELQGTADAVEAAIGLRITTGVSTVEIGIGQIAPAAFATQPLQKGKWYQIELVTLASTTAVGTSDLYVDGTLVQGINTITNTAVLRGVLGTQNTLSTTLGHLFFDQFVFDDTRVGPIATRYPETLWITKSQHVCVGQSDLLNVTLLPGTGTNSVLKIYDTDTATTLDEGNIVAHLFNLTGSEPPIDLADVPVCVRRGAYVELAGTAPRALVHVGCSQGYYSAGRIRQHGSNV
ncbi:MAG: hypothetical protein ACRD32_08920, partial [Nitrososphaerales archaeon]